jgi:hypothetical protein
MATNTPNFNLIKPDLTDNVDIGDINSNMDIIDGAIPATFGDISGVSLSTPTTGDVLRYDGTDWKNVGIDAALGAGKVLQIAEATDSTTRSTSSTTFVDSGFSITFTPRSATSDVYIYYIGQCSHTYSSNTGQTARFQITNSANTALSGAGDQLVVFDQFNINTGTGATFEFPLVMIGKTNPGVTTAVTYKVRFRIEVSGTASLVHAGRGPGRLLAIEVAV